MGIKIGNRNFKSKKDALSFYKEILNSYDFEQSLSDTHYDDVLDLIDYDYLNYVATQEENIDTNQQIALKLGFDDSLNADEYSIIDIKIGRAQFNTKCFEVHYKNGESGFISYIMMINNKPTSPETLFLKTCRNTVQEDLFSVKQKLFDEFSVKGKVKCQETKKLSFWEELVVDHRQPNTLSVIADRFRELNDLQLVEIEYFADDKNQLMFKDAGLREAFSDYHKQKATLRIVRKECNSSRAALARVQSNSKDLKID